MSDRKPIVIWIDDLQWGDLDSGSLLRELVRPPDPPSVMLLLSYRSEDLEASLVDEVRRGIPELRVPSEAALPGSWSGDLLPYDRGEPVYELPLEPLDDEERTELATKLLDNTTDAYRRHLAAIVSESRGNPFFLCEMARYLAESVEGTADWREDSLALADVVSPRIEALPPDARRLLEVVSVAGRPIGRGLALRAAGLGAGARPLVSQMVEESLLRRTAIGEGRAIAPYHDRIREATIDLVPGERLRRIHRRIAEVLERFYPDDLEGLVGHWTEAGDRVRAGGYALRAADRAASTLAFGRAAEMYRQALVLTPDVTDRWEAIGKRGEALANAGRGVEAAATFLEAAAALEDHEADATRALWWRGRAAEHYIKAGDLDQGWGAMRDVLGRIKVPVPASAAACATSSALLRTRLLLRGFKFEEREAADVDRQLGTRLEVQWRIATAFAMVNFTLSDVLAVRHLLQVLQVGDRSRVAHALANEAAFEAILKGSWFRKRVDKLMRSARSIWETSSDPYDIALLEMTQGIIALFDGRFREVVERCDAGEVILREQCLGAHWEIGVCHNFALSGLAMLGEMGELYRRLHEVIRDAELRGDRWAQDSARMGEPAMGWLAADRPEEARRQLALAQGDLGTRKTEWPESSYRTQHYHRLIAVVNVALYEGRVDEAWTEVEEAWPELTRAGFLRIRFTGAELRQLRARAAIAAASSPEAAPPRAPSMLRAIAAKEAKRLRKDGADMADGWGELARAALAVADVQPERVVRHLSAAVARFDDAGMGLYREAARWRLGHQLGGDDGERMAGEAATWLQAHGVVRPETMVEMLAPGF